MFKNVPPELEFALALEVAVGLYVVCNPRYTFFAHRQAEGHKTKIGRAHV